MDRKHVTVRFVYIKKYFSNLGRKCIMSEDGTAN